MNGIPNVRQHDVCTCAKCNTKANRIAAFAAMRRAATVARDADRLADVVDDKAWASRLYREAAGARAAIRAAIGSDHA